jgi:hypothetical protein
MGEGVRPNYEIVVVSRFSYSANSKQHKLEAEKYKDEHLSVENFSLAEMKVYLKSID